MRFWPTCAIGLGAWEAAAVTTRRVPTVSTTVRRARQRARRTTEALVLTWALALVAHLLRHGGTS